MASYSSQSFLCFPGALLIVYLIYSIMVKSHFLGTIIFICCREAGAETKFKEISNAYEVKEWFIIAHNCMIFSFIHMVTVK